MYVAQYIVSAWLVQAFAVVSLRNGNVSWRSVKEPTCTTRLYSYSTPPVSLDSALKETALNRVATRA